LSRPRRIAAAKYAVHRAPQAIGNRDGYRIAQLLNALAPFETGAAQLKDSRLKTTRRPSPFPAGPHPLGLRPVQDDDQAFPTQAAPPRSIISRYFPVDTYPIFPGRYLPEAIPAGPARALEECRTLTEM
jgi:hypothetical protein